MAELARAQVRTELALDRLAESQAKTERELREFKAEMAEFRHRSEAEMAEFKATMWEAIRGSSQRTTRFEMDPETDRNLDAEKAAREEEWRDVIERLGMMIDAVALPNVERIATEELGVNPLVDLARRYERRDPGGAWSEWDVVAAGRDAVVCCEVRSRLATADVSELVQKFASFKDVFSEYAALRLIKMVASWSVEQPVLEELTRHRIYAMGMSRDAARLLNRAAIEQASSPAAAALDEGR